MGLSWLVSVSGGRTHRVVRSLLDEMKDRPDCLRLENL